MTRSFRHTPITGITTARSERSDKAEWHRRLRSKVHTEIKSGKDGEVDIKEVSDPWDMAKDGKARWREIQIKHMRK